MRAVLDACVLFPPVMREMLLGAAAAGAFEPLWSARILEEWARATRRLPEGAEAAARAEIARLHAAWPTAEVAADPDLEASISLPDLDDRHVLATAIGGGAGLLVTLNRADFPSRILARHAVLLREPDGLLTEIDGGGLDLLPVAQAVRVRAGRAAGIRQLPEAGRPAAARQGAGRACARGPEAEIVTTDSLRESYAVNTPKAKPSQGVADGIRPWRPRS